MGKVTRRKLTVGPVTLASTGTVPIPDAQLRSRLYEIEQREDQEQLKAALLAQADAEESPPAYDPEEIRDFQERLQDRAVIGGIDVVVPFARVLAEEVSKNLLVPRVLRDTSRLHSLIKACAILRHQKRPRLPDGRLVALLEDYAVVYWLLKDTYQASTTGATAGARKAAEAVAHLCKFVKEGVTVAMVADHMRINRFTTGRYVRNAIQAGWVLHAEEDRHIPHSAWRLLPGSPPPDQTYLPAPDNERLKQRMERFLAAVKVRAYGLQRVNRED